MSNNMIDTLLVGAGNMAMEHCKVLKDIHPSFVVVGRGKNSAKTFEEKTGMPVLCEDVKNVVKTLDNIPKYAVVAVSVEQLKNVTASLILLGIEKIIVEKPAGLNIAEIKELYDLATEKKVDIFVGYNRRFYSSVEKAIGIIENDGGVISYNFEFTEWPHTIEPLDKPKEVKESWLLANSTHVMDLAFFLGGRPEVVSAYVRGGLKWHPSGSRYCGAGISDKQALFNYAANWEAPGRWGIEILTKKHRLYFRPLEQLSIQENRTTKIEDLYIDDRLDKLYKPGVYKMLKAFFEHDDDQRLVSIKEHYKNAKVYEMIAEGNGDRLR